MIITIVCIDCLRYDVARDRSVMPNVGRFFDEGVEFTAAFSAGPSTFPSVPTYLTGMVTSEHGVIETYFQPRVQTWPEKLAQRGFHTVCYTANHFTYALSQCFQEWQELPWMDNPHNTKSTQDTYEPIWDRIAKEKGDALFYVHLMDVHPPYRLTSTITNADFPLPIDRYDLNQAMIASAHNGIDLLNDEQWDKLYALMTSEASLIDGRLQFPGDLVFLMPDHGDLVGERYLGVRRWSHNQKHFTDEQLHIPFAYQMKGEAAHKIKWSFCTRFLGDLVFALLDDSVPWPEGDELYWEDYWHGQLDVAIKNPAHPSQTLVFSANHGILLNGKAVKLFEVPRNLLELMLESTYRHNNHQGLFRTMPMQAAGDDEKIVRDRLKALGYI